MTYKCLMVHLDASQTNKAVLDVTAALASRYRAAVIGVAACEPIQIGWGDGMMSGEVAVAERQVVDDRLKIAAEEFHACAAIRGHVIGWHAIPTLEPIAHVVALEARGADLLITGVTSGFLTDTTGQADTADLVIRAGRPVLAVPPTPATSTFDRIMLAWNDTRECRRAAADALPLLKDAEKVVVVGIGRKPADLAAGIKDVVEWLARHGIDADRIVARPAGRDTATHDATSGATLGSIAAEHEVDLIVAGAYGHDRLREWAFGGVTRDLLLRENRCVLLSH